MRLPEQLLSRRALFRSGAGAVTALGLAGLPAPVAGATPDRAAPTRTAQLSPNGWEVQHGTDIGGAVWTRPVAGSDVSVPVHIGDVETVLMHVIRRFHYEIGTLRPVRSSATARPRGRGPVTAPTTPPAPQSICGPAGIPPAPDT